MTTQTKKQRLLDNLKSADPCQLFDWVRNENYFKCQNDSKDIEQFKQLFIDLINNYVREEDIAEGHGNGYTDGVYHINPIGDYIVGNMFIPNFKD